MGGCGDAEVFSLSPTKVLVAGEGGVIATDDDTLAERCRIGRDYGNPGDYDCLFVGLNARMSELHAALGLASLDGLDERIDDRNELASRYRAALGDLPGISFPQVPEGDRSTFKDSRCWWSRSGSGCIRPTWRRCSRRRGSRLGGTTLRRCIACARTGALADTNSGLATTDLVSDRVLTLPLWNGMTSEEVDRVADAGARIHHWVPRSRSAAVDLRSDDSSS